MYSRGIELFDHPQGVKDINIYPALINSLDAPARQAFVVEMVENREDLPNAIALNSSMFNSARLIGPAVAGLMIARVGEAWCFAIDAVSYFAVLIALLMMKLSPKIDAPPSTTAVIAISSYPVPASDFACPRCAT